MGSRLRALLLTPSTLLLAVLLALVLAPSAGAGPAWGLAALALLAKATQLGFRALARDPRRRRATDDVLAVFYVALGLWQLLTARLGILGKLLFPAPQVVLAMFLQELPDMAAGLGHSLLLLASGFGLALLTAVPLGIAVGVSPRLRGIAEPYMRVLGPIPPIVFIPYAISLLPTFRASSIFVIFLGGFWPILGDTIHGVLTIPRTLTDSARVLGLRGPTLYLRVILPGALPSICNGANLALLFSFLMLAAAELIGSSIGIGWWVKHFSDFGDYPRVLSGLFFFGLVVTAVGWGAARLQRRLLRWTDQAR
jgi:NitT/TauT family transport system permease protein